MTEKSFIFAEDNNGEPYVLHIAELVKPLVPSQELWQCRSLCGNNFRHLFNWVEEEEVESVQGLSWEEATEKAPAPDDWITTYINDEDEDYCTNCLLAVKYGIEWDKDSATRLAHALRNGLSGDSLAKYVRLGGTRIDAT